MPEVAGRALKLHESLYERAAVERAAETLAPWATIRVSPAGPDGISVVDIEPKAGVDLHDVIGEFGNHALVATIELRREA